MGRFKKWFKATARKLRERATWGIFTGVVQAIGRFIADYVGLPATVVAVVLTGGAMVIDFITGIPSQWVWFAAAVTLTLGVPPAIRASAELRSASAKLIHAASRKQKLDQAEIGLRVPKATPESPEKTHKSTEGLERLYSEGEQLLERDKSMQPKEWRQKIMNWFDQSGAMIKEDAPSEAFLFRTISRRPKPDEKFDDCPKLLAARLVKLRLIIGRMQGRQED